MSIVNEFKEFALKGNVMDMAVGIIIGGAFGKIVASAVEDLIMPPVGMLVGGVDFTDLAMKLKDAAEGAPAVTLNYGKFIQTSLDFTIMAFAIFMMVKGVNSLKRDKPVEAAPKEPSAEEKLLMEIRDLLKK
jgi:large conductance mechanosensitive channel